MVLISASTVKTRSSIPIEPLPLYNKKTLEEDPQLAEKLLCLKRDNFRCIATKLLDISAESNPEAVKCDTDVTSILPFSIGWSENTKEVY
jgi:hypothetical protein